MTEHARRRVIYLIACGTPVAQRLYTLVPLLQARGWDVYVVLTPMATRFVDAARLHTLTGHAVRSEDKQPNEPGLSPRADAVIVFPATFNTLNKWAEGIGDTLALGLLCELTSLKVPILAIPLIRKGGELDTHPAFIKSLHLLRGYGVHTFYEPDMYPPRNEISDEGLLRELQGML